MRLENVFISNSKTKEFYIDIEEVLVAEFDISSLEMRLTFKNQPCNKIVYYLENEDDFYKVRNAYAKCLKDRYDSKIRANMPMEK